MGAPPGIAKFDSSTAMLQALARCLKGRDFAGLGQSKLLQFFVRRADWLPPGLRNAVFARLGAQEAVDPGEIDKVRATEVAEWMQGLYPQRRYPAVMIGSSNGALTHLAAALGIPWLPQTFLTLVRHHHPDPDDPARALEGERETGARFLAANPGQQLHHLHDPAQDRLMLQHITYYRSKFLGLPPAYTRFLERSLEPGGTILVAECERRWPVTRLGERQVYQFGAVGGPSVQEYFEGSGRVAEYLERQGAPRRRWEPPAPNEECPEAEWGFEPELTEALRDYARAHGHPLVRVRFTEPEDPSPLVAQLYRAWNEERGVHSSRLVIESFIVMEPYWVLRTGATPFWMTFNMQPSLERLRRYLETARPYDEIYLMLFAHGVESVGLPPIAEWRKLLGHARQRGELVGVDPGEYPAHFAGFGRYSQELRRTIAARYPLPPPLPLERVLRYVEEHGPPHGVRLAWE